MIDFWMYGIDFGSLCCKFDYYNAGQESDEDQLHPQHTMHVDVLKSNGTTTPNLLTQQSWCVLKANVYIAACTLSVAE